jgi:hypothetical protein
MYRAFVYCLYYNQLMHIYIYVHMTQYFLYIWSSLLHVSIHLYHSLGVPNMYFPKLRTLLKWKRLKCWNEVHIDVSKFVGVSILYRENNVIYVYELVVIKSINLFSYKFSFYKGLIYTLRTSFVKKSHYLMWIFFLRHVMYIDKRLYFSLLL